MKSFSNTTFVFFPTSLNLTRVLNDVQYANSNRGLEILFN